MAIFDLNIDSVDGEAREWIEVSGAKMADLTIMLRSDLSTLKWKYDQGDKRFYKNPENDDVNHAILGDSTYC